MHPYVNQPPSPLTSRAGRSGGSTQGLGGAKPPQITKKEGFSPPNSKGGT